MGLKIEDITYTYDSGTAMSVNALNHITTEIPDGQFIGLIGHTGSGKSTFVQMLNGLLKATSGHIYYNGEDIDADGYDKKKLRSRQTSSPMSSSAQRTSASPRRRGKSAPRKPWSWWAFPRSTGRQAPLTSPAGRREELPSQGSLRWSRRF